MEVFHGTRIGLTEELKSKVNAQGQNVATCWLKK